MHQQGEEEKVRADGGVFRLSFLEIGGRAQLESRHVDEEAGMFVVQRQRRHGELGKDPSLVDAHVDELRCFFIGFELDAVFS
jgi:hypothetical protein